jgi:hypothetical protein
MGQKVEKRRGPRIRLSGQTSEGVSGGIRGSESLKDFRDLTDGLSNRLELPSLEAMRAGAVNNPISLMRRFLVAMRSAGLPKERAMRVSVWMERQIDALWPMEHTPIRVLEERAMVAEAEDDIAQQRHNLDRTIASLEFRISTLTNEIVADKLCLANYQRERETLK